MTGESWEIQCLSISLPFTEGLFKPLPVCLVGAPTYLFVCLSACLLVCLSFQVVFLSVYSLVNSLRFLPLTFCHRDLTNQKEAYGSCLVVKDTLDQT